MTSLRAITAAPVLKFWPITRITRTHHPHDLDQDGNRLETILRVMRVILSSSREAKEEKKKRRSGSWWVYLDHETCRAENIPRITRTSILKTRSHRHSWPTIPSAGDHSYHPHREVTGESVSFPAVIRWRQNPGTIPSQWGIRAKVSAGYASRIDVDDRAVEAVGFLSAVTGRPPNTAQCVEYTQLFACTQQLPHATDNHACAWRGTSRGAFDGNARKGRDPPGVRS